MLIWYIIYCDMIVTVAITSSTLHNDPFFPVVGIIKF